MPDGYQNPDLSMSLRDRVSALEDAIGKDPNYCGPDTVAIRDGQLKLLSVSEGRTEWEISVVKSIANKAGNLHGGSACVILDNLTSTALLTVAKPGFLDAGHVSRTITMSYLRPVPLGSRVKVVCELVSAGKRTANIRGEIWLDGKICVTCIHDKAVFVKGEVHPKQRAKL